MTTISVPEILRAVALRRVLIGALALCFFALVLAFAFLARPTYSAVALVEVKAKRDEPLASQGANAAGPDAAAMLANLNTEATRLGAEPVVQLVYAELGARYFEAMRQTSPYAGLRRAAALFCADPSISAVDFACDALRLRGGRATDERAAFRNFHKAFDADAIRGSRLIRITASAPDPVLAATMANALAQTYIQVRSEELATYNVSFVAWLQSRLGEMGERVGKSDLAVAEYRRQNNLIELARDVDAARRTPVTEQLAGMLADLATVTSQRAQAEVRLARMQALRANPQSVMNSSEVVGSDVIRDLMGREAAARQRMADLRSTYGDRHPMMVAAAAEANELRARIASEANRVLEAATQDYERASAVVTRLTAEVARQQSRAGAEQVDRVRLRDLERRARADGELHAAFQRFTEEAVERATWREPVVQLVANAAPPERAAFPNKRVVLPAGFIASFSLALLAGVGAEMRRQGRSFQDPADLEAATGLPVVGTVPDGRRPTRIPCPSEVWLAVEAIGMQVMHRGSRRADPGANRRGRVYAVTRGRVYAVTSCAQGDGKSALSIALARWMQTAAKRRTLLVDADLRRPAVLREAGPTTPAPDWAASLPIRVEEGTGLAILPLTELATDPFAAIQRFDEILDDLRESFGAIIVDTPPVLAVPDAIGIARRADLTLFVVRWASTRRRSLAYALDRFDAEARARIALVHNRINVRSFRRYEAPGAERYGSRGYEALRQSPIAARSGAADAAGAANAPEALRR